MTCVLVVEDEPTVRRAIVRALTASKWQVSQAGTVASALRCASELSTPIECAVLDLELPDGSGLDLATRLKARDPEIQIVFFSGSEDPELLSQASSLALSVHKSEGIRTLVEQVLELMRPPTRSQAFRVGGESERESGT